MKNKCKVIGCNNREMDGDFGIEGHRWGYCQIHKIEGLVKDVEVNEVGGSK